MRNDLIFYLILLLLVLHYMFNPFELQTSSVKSNKCRIGYDLFVDFGINPYACCCFIAFDSISIVGY